MVPPCLPGDETHSRGAHWYLLPHGMQRCRDLRPAPAWGALQSERKDSLALPHRPAPGSRGCRLKQFPSPAEFGAEAHGWARNRCEASSAAPCLDPGSDPCALWVKVLPTWHLLLCQFCFLSFDAHLPALLISTAFLQVPRLGTFSMMLPYIVSLSLR